MKKKVIIPLMCLFMFALFTTIIGTSEVYAQEEQKQITFKDENMYNAIKQKVEGKIVSYDDTKKEITMTKGNIDSITGLDLTEDNKIVDISGIENFTNLHDLRLSNNKISDINVLSSLTNLEKLYLEYNQISDINALSSLTNLRILHLDNNQINNISALSGLINLTYLYLYDNQISDISALSKLTNLTGLYLYDNQISDISALSKLTNLNFLYLSDNQISNISALSELTNLTDLYLYDNQISNISVLSSLTNLTNLDLGYNQISDISVLSELTNLTRLSLGKIQISDISDISVLSELTNLTNLDLYDNQISDISVLSSLINLEYLNLSDNQISDIRTLSGLTNLTSLYLSDNQISNISALSELTNLETLWLDYNKISDIRALSELTSLRDLYLYDNQISDISALSKLTNLTNLDLGYNQISDTSILDNELKNCNWVHINNQELNIQTNNQKVKLPNIFLQSKDPKSSLYSADYEYELENCKFSDDGTSVIVDNNSDTASIKINGNKTNIRRTAGTTLNIKISGNATLETTLSKTPEEMTNGNVKVTISANNMLENLEGWSLSKDETVLTKEYDKNTQEEVVVTDKHGNKQSIKVIVDNIDKDPPIIDYSTRKNEDGSIEIILKSNEKVKEIEGWNLSEDKMTLTKTYKEAKEEEISVYDLVGNETKVNLKINIINNKLSANIENAENNPKTGDNSIFYLLLISSAIIIEIILFALSNKKNSLTKRDI